jgi:hypothetical protein
LGAQTTCIFDSGVHGMVGQVAQAYIPVLANGCLTEASDDNVCHIFLNLFVIASRPEFVEGQRGNLSARSNLCLQVT